jgi:hypothetical protein
MWSVVLAQALAACDRMTPNAFTVQAEQTVAARNDPTTGIDEPGGSVAAGAAGSRLWPRRKGFRVRLQRVQVGWTTSTEPLRRH